MYFVAFILEKGKEAKSEKNSQVFETSYNIVLYMNCSELFGVIMPKGF